MKFYFSFCLFIVIGFTAFAQKPTSAYSCQNNKSKSGVKSINASLDNRGDFINITNYKIDLDISNFVTKELSGNTQVSFVPLVAGINSIALDLLVLTVDSVKIYDTVLLNYTHNDTLINIDFPSVLTKNSSYRMKVYYHGAPIQTPGDWGGFFWNATYAFNIGVSFTEDIHNFGKAWFPCFDNFTERSTYDFVIKTRPDHKAFCNGLLQSEINNPDGSKTWTWKLNQEIPTYLANVAVANYATVNQVYNKLAGGNVPIQLGARASDTTNLKNSFVHLNDALLSFETRFGPYRFDRVGYCVTSFSAGAMEHATNITYMSSAVDGTTTWETLMAHELSHHWFGNNTTCETAGDMWLNEGWASYAEAIFTESVYGTEAFKDYNRENHDDVLRMLAVNEGYLPVSGVASPQTYSSTVYDKGADMAHTLRGILGDQIFFAGMKAFQEQYKFKDISTDKLNAFLSNYSSLNLTSFFNTWVKEKGFHHYEIADYSAVAQSSGFSVQGTVKQKLWEAPTYTDFLPVPISFFDSAWNRVDDVVFVYGACSNFQFNLDFEPVFWALDLDEKIQDATVDKYEIINTTGATDFGFARLLLNVDSLSDSALVRVEHHFIKPDAMVNKIADLHLSPNRYWSFSGILPADFKANADFLYNGSTNTTSGYLDNDFISTTENNLVMLYRPNQQTDWTLVTDFVLNTQGNANNKTGKITVNNIQKGDYVMGIYDAAKAQDTDTKDECVFTSIKNVERLDKLINVFPVPTKSFFSVELLAPDLGIESFKIYNVLGKEITKIDVSDTSNIISVYTSSWAKGTYIISFADKTNKVLLTKKLVVE